MNNIEKLAKLGEQHDIMDALRLLSEAYINMCGISAGCRTVIFYAAEAWQERLAWMDLPLSEIARKNALTDFMPYVTSHYDPEIYDRYDIAAMDNEELLNYCEQIVNEESNDRGALLGIVESYGRKERTFTRDGNGSV